MALALRHPPLFKPGAAWSYSNTNYILLGLLIEKVTGHPYGSEITQRILDPLGLRDTLVPGDSAEIPGPHAHGYLPVPASYAAGGLVDISRLNPSWSWAAGEMLSTISDLNRFFAALTGGRLLPPAEFAQMTRAVPAKQEWFQYPGASYGLGLERIPLPCGGSAWGHGGDIQGYSTRAWTASTGRQVALSLTLARITPTAPSCTTFAPPWTGRCAPPVEPPCRWPGSLRRRRQHNRPHTGLTQNFICWPRRSRSARRQPDAHYRTGRCGYSRSRHGTNTVARTCVIGWSRAGQSYTSKLMLRQERPPAFSASWCCGSVPRRSAGALGYGEANEIAAVVGIGCARVQLSRLRRIKDWCCRCIAFRSPLEIGARLPRPFVGLTEWAGRRAEPG